MCRFCDDAVDPIDFVGPARRLDVIIATEPPHVHERIIAGLCDEFKDAFLDGVGDTHYKQYLLVHFKRKIWSLVVHVTKIISTA